ncbi:hypothetical protein NMG60_11014935 [Bertholletia excelsa]
MNSSHNRRGLSAGSGSGNPAPKMPKDEKEKEVPKTTPEHNPKHLATKSEESTPKSKSPAYLCFGPGNGVNPESRTTNVAPAATVALEKQKKKTEVATRKQGPSDEERTSKSKSPADIALSRRGNVYTYNSPGEGQQPSAADLCFVKSKEVNLETQTSPATVAVEKPKKKTEDETRKQGPSDSKQQQQSDPKKEKKGDREDATKKQGPSDSKQQQQSDPKKGKKGDREDATKKQGPSDSKQQQQSDPKKEQKGDRKPQSE